MTLWLTNLLQSLALLGGPPQPYIFTRLLLLESVPADYSSPRLTSPCVGVWPLSGCVSTEGVRSGTGTLALPSSGELMGSSSSEHGSVSPDSDAQPDAFFEKVQVPKHQLSHLLRYCHCPLSPWWSSEVYQLFLNRTLVGSKKRVLQGSRVAKETVFTQGPFSVLSLLCLS